MKKLLLILSLLMIYGCVETPTQPEKYEAPDETTVTDDKSVLNELNIPVSEQQTIETREPSNAEITEEPSEQESSTLSLEIKESITLDKSLTFYNYTSQGTGNRTDKTFYFTLEPPALYLEELDAITKFRLGDEFRILSPWKRDWTVQYNILKSTVRSKVNKDQALEIYLLKEGNKVHHIKLGSNTFYAFKPQTFSKPIMRSWGNKKGPNSYTHIVTDGDNIKYLAQHYGMSEDALLDLNPWVRRRSNLAINIGETLKLK